MFVNAEEQFESLTFGAGAPVVASADADVLSRCLQRSVETINLWGYMDVTDSFAHLHQALDICTRIADALGGVFVSSGVDVVERQKNDLLYSFYGILNWNALLTRFFERNRPKRVACFTELNRPIFWDDTPAPPDVFNALVLWHAEQAGIPVQPLTCAGVKRPVVFFGPEPRTGPARKVALPEPGNLDNSILCLAEGLSLTEMRPLLGRFDAEEQGYLVYSNRASDRGPTANLSLLHALPFRAGCPARGDAESRDGLNARVASALHEDEAVLLRNPHLGFVWDWVYGHMVTSGARECSIAAYMLLALAPKTVVCGYDMWGWLRCQEAVFKKAGLSLLSVDHVGLPTEFGLVRNDGARVPASVWGEKDVTAQSPWRAEDAPAHSTGSMREDLVRHVTQGDVSHRTRTVVLATSLCYESGYLLTWIDPPRLEESWNSLLDLAGRRREWRFLIKVHPRTDHYYLYQRLLARGEPNVQMDRRPADEVLREAGVLVLVNNPSTVAVHAIQRGVPVLYLRDIVPSIARWPFGDDVPVSVCSADEMETEVRRLFEDENYRGVVLERQKAGLGKYLAATGEDAVQRIWNLVEGALAARNSDGVITDVDHEAQWLLKLIIEIGNLQENVISWSDFKGRTEGLRREGIHYVFEHLDMLDVPRLGESLLSMVLWQKWYRDITDLEPCPSVASALCHLYRALPRSIRPSVRVLRRYLVQALLRDTADTSVPKPGRGMALVTSRLLAPGRILADVREAIRGRRGE